MMKTDHEKFIFVVYLIPIVCGLCESEEDVPTLNYV